MPMAEDLTKFFDTDEHASAATLDGEGVVGIFERPHAEFAGMGSTAPTFLMPEADLGDAGEGSTLVVGGDTFTVRVPEPDGTGLVLLPLEAAS